LIVVPPAVTTYVHDRGCSSHPSAAFTPVIEKAISIIEDTATNATLVATRDIELSFDNLFSCRRLDRATRSADHVRGAFLTSHYTPVGGCVKIRHRTGRIGEVRCIAKAGVYWYVSGRTTATAIPGIRRGGRSESARLFFGCCLYPTAWTCATGTYSDQ
jgi:hypothetical protein